MIIMRNNKKWATPNNAGAFQNDNDKSLHKHTITIADNEENK